MSSILSKSGEMGFDYISSFCNNPVIIIACLCGGQVENADAFVNNPDFLQLKLQLLGGGVWELEHGIRTCAVTCILIYKV